MLPENYKPSKAITIISVIILVAFSVYMFKTVQERKAAFSTGTRYTIGYTTEMYFTTSGRNIRYRYEVDGKEYKGNAGYAYKSQVPNGRYWVKFSIDKPNISIIYQNRPVPVEIDSVKPEGLIVIPK